MNDDVSKKTLLVLVILTIVISLLGTWTVINEANQAGARTQQSESTSTTTGKVSISIERPPQPVSTTGKVILEIKK